MIYKFRIILDAEEDVLRDLEIEADATMEDFHNSITQAFGFEGSEMASFYVSDEEWNQGQEISLFDMSDGTTDVRLMNETTVDSAVSEDENRLIYVYDFFSMWTFFVELAEVAEPAPGITYPNLLFAHGELPANAPEKDFEAESNDIDDEFNDFDIDTDDYDNLDFDENWN